MKKKFLSLVFCDDKGNIYDDPVYIAAARSGHDYKPLSLDECIKIPSGSEFFVLPQRYPIAYDKNLNQVVLKDRYALSVFLAPAYTQLYLPAFKKEENSAVLPLFAYTAVGFYEGNFYVPAVRIDEDKRQDLTKFDKKKIIKSAKDMLNKYSKNRLIKHIIKNCALTYFCPAARNFVLGRYEAPLPTSNICNSRCLGCISQQKHSPIPPTQPRMIFNPSPQEVFETAMIHINRVKQPIVSFGQGCEGEPLLVYQILLESIIKIRQVTKNGTINLNTNGSLTEILEHLFTKGLDSVRISLNSAQEKMYNTYYQPKNYTFDNVKASISLGNALKKWVSLNYFVIPGFTDSEEEFESLRKLVKETMPDMIQWRNLNIDPDWYFDTLNLKNLTKGLGIKNIMIELKKEFPHLKYSYFNPYLSNLP